MRKIGPYILFVVLTGFWVSGCNQASAADGKSHEGKSKPAAQSAANGEDERQTRKTVNVEVLELQPESLTEFVTAHGVTKAIRDITYAAELPGRIEYLSADLGDTVKKGQVLARIDFKTLKAQANQAEVSYELAKKTHERLAKLKAEDLVSEQRLDEVQSNMLSSRAGLEIANANVSKSTIVATYGGVVGTRYVERGEYVSPGTPLFHLIDYRTIIVEAQVPETQVAQLKKGANVSVEIGALKRSFEGTVDAIVPAADNVSKTFRVRVKIDNKDMQILVGMSAKVRIDTQKLENVVVARHSSIIEEKNGRSVFVAEDGKAQKRQVRLGAMEGDRVVIQDGVKFGEKLIVVGQRELSDGQPIQVVQ